MYFEVRWSVSHDPPSHPHPQQPLVPQRDSSNTFSRRAEEKNYNHRFSPKSQTRRCFALLNAARRRWSSLVTAAAHHHLRKQVTTFDLIPENQQSYHN